MQLSKWIVGGNCVLSEKFLFPLSLSLSVCMKRKKNALIELLLRFFFFESYFAIFRGISAEILCVYAFNRAKKRNVCNFGALFDCSYFYF